MNKIVHYIGLDVHKDSIAVSIAPQNSTEVRRYGIIGGTLDAVDSLLKKLTKPELELRFVYEAGPCGFVICRHLRNKGLHCDLVCPSLIPKKASERIKTDRRDADQLARLYRAGELTAIRVPDQEDEAIRDLIRGRAAAVRDQRQARNRLKGFLLRLGFRYTGKASWNDGHKRYLSGLLMPRPAQQIVFQEYIHATDDAAERVTRLTQAVEDALAGWKWEPVVRALMALRGIQVLSGMTLIAEAGDLSRFGDPRSLMHFFGLTPSEHSSGTKRVQGGITKGGNAYCRHIMTEAAWHYRLKPLVSEAMQKRQEHQSKEVRLIAWKAQQRLHKRFRRLVVRKKSVVVATAIARELVGFVWAIACQVKPADRPPEPEIIRTCRGKVYVLDPNKKMPKTK
jgi:transposase